MGQYLSGHSHQNSLVAHALPSKPLFGGSNSALYITTNIGGGKSQDAPPSG